jgi:predicted RNA-binding Zn-ribbon protein involved in translation (DUF1610 family)/uncharacterized protein YneF (UPF0154 family)
MWYILIALFLITSVFFGSRVINSQIKANPNAESSLLKSPISENDTIKAMFSKKQIEKKLKHLAETPAPTNLSFGAMCYEMVAVDYDTHEYICPICGEKTVYKKNKNKEKFNYISGVIWEISACRREIEKVNGINIKLDEKQFCSHCSPKTERPELFLLVNIKGQNDTTKISNFSSMDIRILKEFLDDKLVHKTDYDSELPLVDNIERIKELLGIK